MLPTRRLPSAVVGPSLCPVAGPSLRCAAGPLASAIFGAIFFTAASWWVPSVVQASRAEIDSLNALGRHHVFAHVKEALEAYARAAEEARRLDYPAGEARALQSLAIAQYLDGDHEAGTRSSLEAIRLFEALDDRHALAMTWGELGYHTKRRDLPRALSSMRTGVGIAEAAHDSVALCALYDNIGVLHEMDARPDSAEHFYRAALAFKTALDDSLGIPFTLNKLGGIALLRGEFDAAAALLARSDAHRHALGDEYGLLVNAVIWGDLESARGDLPSAAEHYERALAMPVAAGNAAARQHCHDQLATIYERQGAFERAIAHHRTFAAVRDSLASAETVSRIAELELRFDSERKDRLLAERSLAVNRRTRQVAVLGAALVLVALVGAGAARHQALRRRQLREQLRLEEQVRQTEIERNVAREKLRISQDLHDNIGSQITFLASSLDNLTHDPSASGIREDLTVLGGFGRQALDELRQTVWAMSAPDDDLDGLLGRLDDIRRRCALAGRKLHVTTGRAEGSTGRMSAGLLLNVLRIAQEGVQNALKHTSDGPIALHLDAGAGRMVLRVSDQGPGFDPSAVRNVGGLGTMKRRCAEAGGTFSAESGASGTTITCAFPLE